MDSKIAQLLKSANVSERRQGINLLAQSNNPDDLNIIVEVFKREKDLQTKALAKSVGKAMQQKFTNPSQSPTNDATNYQSQALHLLGRADTALNNVNYAEAQRLLTEAFQLEPRLKRDEYARKLAANAYATTEAQGVNLAMGIEQLADAMYYQELQDVRRKNGDVGFVDAIIDLGLMGLCAGALSFVNLLFLSLTLGRRVSEYMASNNISATSAFGYNFGWLTIIDIPVAGFASLGVIATMLGSIVPFTIFIHVAATNSSALDGDGTWSGLIRHLRMPVIAYAVTTGITYFVGEYIVTNAYLNSYINGIAVSPSQIAESEQILQLINAVVALIYVAWLSHAIGKNYKNGTLMGFLTIIMGFIVAGMFACCFVFFMSMV